MMHYESSKVNELLEDKNANHIIKKFCLIQKIILVEFT